MRAKTCNGCGNKFVPIRPLQAVCDKLECAILAVEAKKRKDARKEYREAKQRIKSRATWLKEAQIAFNRYIRARDEGKPCISCGSLTGKKNAGHYRSVGAAPELRFNELNVHLQCEKCNSYLSSNAVEYRINLVKKIGIEKVEWLEEKHEPKKYTVDEIKAIKSEYTRKAKEATR